MTLKWPEAHRQHYEQQAAREGISLSEYVIRRMAALHGLIEPEEEGAMQLRLTG